MHAFTHDCRKDRPDPRVWVHRTFHALALPRLIPVCRTFGHKPVVDGYDAQYGTRERSRWVACGRCGVRPEPQGLLDPDQWDLGQRYTGPFHPGQPTSPEVRKQLAVRGHDAGIRHPGAWPARPEGGIGAELVIGRAHTIGAGLKVGNQGSEHTLAAHVCLGPLGALFLWTEDYGTWLQRRLNPVGYESRVIDLSFHHGRVWWQLWARRNEHRATDPWWMSVSLNINPAHYLLGARINQLVDSTEKAPTTVELPDGTSYPVTVRLEKWQSGRPRGRKKYRWTLDWESRPGIPIRNEAWKGDETYGGHWQVPADVVDDPQWLEAAARSIADKCMADRERYSYRTPTP